jgi:hypothetical protein
MTKKLEGNGLWESSRMMLPQHKEQSMPIQNNTFSRASEPVTKQEIEVIRDSIILPMALGIVEKNSREVAMSSLTLKLLFSNAAKILAKQIRADAQKSKKALVDRDISVTQESKDDSELIYRYVCRGHEDRFVMTKEFVRAEIGVRIGRYAKSLVGVLQEAGKG